MNAYTISSGIFPKYLNGENIISVPLAENETMHIGYVLNENQELSELGKSYLEELRKYAPAIIFIHAQQLIAGLQAQRLGFAARVDAVDLDRHCISDRKSTRLNSSH